MSKLWEIYEKEEGEAMTSGLPNSSYCSVCVKWIPDGQESMHKHEPTSGGKMDFRKEAIKLVLKEFGSMSQTDQPFFVEKIEQALKEAFKSGYQKGQEDERDQLAGDAEWYNT
jgi:hypothetical protein